MRSARLIPEHRDVASELQQKFINKHDRSVAVFYDHLSATLKERAKDKEIELLLLGFDSQHGRLKVMHAPERFNNASDLAVGRGVSGTAFRTRSVAYWEVPVDDMEIENQPPEQIIEDYAPGFVIAFPLAFPRINAGLWAKLVEAGNAGRCPVFGVVVVAGAKADDEFRKINPKALKDPQEKDERNEIITGFYSLIIKSLQVSFPEYFDLPGSR